MPDALPASAPALPIPRVIDISHHNTGPLRGEIDFGAAAAAGIWGAICKASEGVNYADPTYDVRRPLIKAAGLEHGAYHFCTGEDVTLQAERFFAQMQPDDRTAAVLDWERQTKLNLGQMGISQALDFLHQIEVGLGRKAKIYSGDVIKSHIAELASRPLDLAYLLSHDLWLAQYGRRAVLPTGFTKYWIWQFTGDGFGLPPHSIAGENGAGCDLNTFNGTRADLAASWVA